MDINIKKFDINTYNSLCWKFNIFRLWGIYYNKILIINSNKFLKSFEITLNV